MIPIPFNRPSIAGREFELMREAIANGHISGDGAFTRRASAMLEAITGAPRVLLTTSCTHALEMAAMLLDVKPGDEVIVPAFTFVSNVNAFVLRGARPVFADIRPDTLNLDESKLEKLVTDATRVIAPVHYAGVACAIDVISEVAAARGIDVVEDNAHGLFGRFRGRPLGTFGRLAALSFHETKNISCGEGGALIVNDPVLIERAEILREKGTNRSRFFRGDVDKYTWVDIGSSYLPSDLLAAFLVGQLEQAESIQTRRRAIWERYGLELADWAEARGVRRPFVSPGCEQSYHMYYLVLPEAAQRDALLVSLRDQSIHAVFHYVPLNASPMGAHFGARAGDCPVAEDVSGRLLRLPLYTSMTDDEQSRVIDAVRAY